MSEQKCNREEGTQFSPKFDEKGLITAVVTGATDGNLLMVAFMNEEALALTLETGIAHYWSRSRQKIWKKGESSGNLQQIEEIRVDCDQDALWLKVHVQGAGATCHTGHKSCFYRHLEMSNGVATLEEDDKNLMFDPDEVYKT
ncbi:phosphoribosyl-AMP cyclohydrolase [Bartonella apis]|uniref:Phosphoribosyl-AMP cyclohydrolase n=1 Tax=Bartonella apis TaxID=1686310 RepID=A0A1R0F754_9HYPH|nr:phosphoribosyl-AMP cyclohydrolase [Bartonella apis]MCT6859899.1 phosphoribosyl-AMP cyclohydrolase [Bartonella apis]OLY42790.1 phosphoribosyl-AMP cyclohydrolase [Bartonella apis]OLY47199.1 phosphoribosyl-AMP cyclohydrolase [Bartonella apis]